MDAQAQSGVGAVESKYLAANEKEGALAAALDHEHGAAIDANDATVQLQVLAREANAHRELYTSLLSRAKEIEIADGLHRTNVDIVALAEVPDAPSIDRFERNLLRGLLFGLCLGLVAAFGLESLDGTVKTPEDVEEGSTSRSSPSSRRSADSRQPTTARRATW